MSKNQSGDLNDTGRIALSFVEAGYRGDEIFGASLSISLAETRTKLQSQQPDGSLDSNTRLYGKNENTKGLSLQHLATIQVRDSDVPSSKLIESSSSSSVSIQANGRATQPTPPFPPSFLDGVIQSYPHTHHTSTQDFTIHTREVLLCAPLIVKKRWRLVGMDMFEPAMGVWYLSLTKKRAVSCGRLPMLST